MERDDRILAQDLFLLPSWCAGYIVWTKVRLSTVFLGIDHSFGAWRYLEDAIPVLWETMVFHGPEHNLQERHSSALAARTFHSEKRMEYLERGWPHRQLWP